jgi:trk system potassium uptake protein TrkH
VLIQFGGLGYMTISSFTVLAVAGDLSPFRQRVSSAALVLPRGFELKSFIQTIFWFTIVVEVVGAACLYPSFAAHGTPQPVWQAVFHSVSAYCTAGFGLFNDSLEGYRDDVWLNSVVSVLSYLGAIGFIVVHDLWRSACSRRVHVTLTSKIILWSTFWITIIGTVLFALGEPTVRDLPLGKRWLTSLFQVMTASTTVGFNTIPIGALSASSLFLLCAIMFVGASPSGTGGGLKTTTFTALWAEMMSVVRRRPATTFMGKAIPEVRLRAAVANALFYGIALAAGIYALALVEDAPLADQLFECASALGTVGLSRGITASLTPLGKTIIILLMFLGRLGPVAFGMAFFQSSALGLPANEEDVAI